MRALIDEIPRYREVALIRADWDKYGGDAIARELRVARRSTLIAFRGGSEVRRVVAATGRKDIAALFEAALKEPAEG